jgi:pimeloyl-ACP methyl ester carboxylesterase
MRVLFVHGACVVDGAWWWHRMVEPLAAHGLRTEAVELPSCGPADGPAPAGDLYADVAAVAAAAAGGPAILVSSSYGGMVTTAAARELPNLRHLVYLSSVLPSADESLADRADPDGPQWLEPVGDGSVRVRADLGAERFTGHFLQDCDAEAVEGALARVGRQAAAAFGQPAGHAGWSEVPSTAVICTADRATDPALQRHWATGRAGAVVELDSGHHPFLSRPAELAPILARCAR